MKLLSQCTQFITGNALKNNIYFYKLHVKQLIKNIKLGLLDSKTFLGLLTSIT